MAEEIYRPSPIVKGGLEILLSVEFKISDQKRKYLERMREIVELNYIQIDVDSFEIGDKKQLGIFYQALIMKEEPTMMMIMMMMMMMMIMMMIMMMMMMVIMVMMMIIIIIIICVTLSARYKLPMLREICICISNLNIYMRSFKW